MKLKKDIKKKHKEKKSNFFGCFMDRIFNIKKISNTYKTILTDNSNHKVKIRKTLTFKILTPVVILVILLGVVFNYSVLNVINEFMDDSIKTSVSQGVTDLYEIANGSFEELASKNLVGNSTEVKIQQGKTYDKFEKYAVENNFEYVILNQRSREIIHRTKGMDVTGIDFKTFDIEFKEIKPLNISGDTFFTKSFEFEIWGWNFLVMKNKNVYQETMDQVNFAYIITFGLLSMMIVLLSYFVYRYVSKPLFQILEDIPKKCAPKITSTHEFDVLSGVIGKLFISDQEYKSSSKKIAKILKNESVGLNTNIGESREVVSYIKNSIKEMEIGIHETTMVAQDSLKLVDNANSKINNAKLISKDISEDVSAVSRISEENISETEKLFEQMSKVYETTDVSIKRGEELFEKTESINGILQDMISISQNSQLLAINARIEAAHAGESGTGFAVVAQEMSNLANLTKEQAEKISNINSEINQSMDMLQNINKANRESVRVSYKIAENTKKSFIEFKNYFNKLNSNINLEEGDIEEIDNAFKHILSEITNLSGITEEQSAATTSIVESVYNYNTQINNIAESSESLEGICNKLEIQMEKDC